MPALERRRRPPHAGEVARSFLAHPREDGDRQALDELADRLFAPVWLIRGKTQQAGEHGPVEQTARPLEVLLTERGKDVRDPPVHEIDRRRPIWRVYEWDLATAHERLRKPAARRAP